MNNPLMWNRQKVQRAYRQGNIVAIAATGLTVRFVLRGGIDSGYLATKEGATRRFPSDEKAWRVVEQLKMG